MKLGFVPFELADLCLLIFDYEILLTRLKARKYAGCVLL
jgi:hypothetical protein